MKVGVPRGPELVPLEPVDCTGLAKYHAARRGGVLLLAAVIDRIAGDEPDEFVVPHLARPERRPGRVVGDAAAFDRRDVDWNSSHTATVDERRKSGNPSRPILWADDEAAGPVSRFDIPRRLA